MDDLAKSMRRRFSKVPTAIAQFGVHRSREPYKYKRQDGKPHPAKWDNLQVLVNGLMRQRRNPIFTTPKERARIKAIWVQFSNLFLKTSRQSLLMRGAKRVAEELIRDYQKHMIEGQTKPGKPGKLPKAAVVARRVHRAAKGNVNYLRSPRIDKARIGGYGVDTGHLFEAMYIGVGKKR